MNHASYIEWAPFRLKPGVSEEDFLRASEALQEDFIDHQPGFVRRELLKGAGREWVDLVYWEDREAAERVAVSAAESPACHAYFQFMEGVADPAAGVLHFERRRQYCAEPAVA